jgi:hypothetical protein
LSKCQNFFDKKGCPPKISGRPFRGIYYKRNVNTNTQP